MGDLISARRNFPSNVNDRNKLFLSDSMGHAKVKSMLNWSGLLKLKGCELVDYLGGGI